LVIKKRRNYQKKIKMVKEIKSEEEFNVEISNSNFNATIVDFTATWCGPCQMIKV